VPEQKTLAQRSGEPPEPPFPAEVLPRQPERVSGGRSQQQPGHARLNRIVHHLKSFPGKGYKTIYPVPPEMSSRKPKTCFRAGPAAGSCGYKK